MSGCFGIYLDVDLSSGRIGEYIVDPNWTSLYLGGRGIAARILIDLVPPEADPLGEQNVVVFGTGPLQGTSVAGAGRHVVMTKSPKTGSLLGSYAGGYFGHELGRSGYDGIILRGRSDAPVYLLLQNGTAELQPADDLWGRTTGETDDALRARHPGVRVACIGPAGERLVQMSCVIHDKTRSAGRSGAGCVLGSKKVKAIAIAGSKEKMLADPEGFKRERTSFLQSIANDPGKRQLGELGTAGVLLALNEIGALPTKLFQEGTFSEASLISGERMVETILVDRETCTGCPIRCKRVVRAESHGTDVDPAYGGPEYETLAAFGSLCLCSDLDTIALANQLCNAYGLDTISCGVAIATLMEASERGLIEDDVPWGSSDAIIEWIHRIAQRSGIGDQIAKGVDAWARGLGLPSVMTIKGVELPMHEPRGKAGLGLSYAVSPRGATHLESIHDTMAEVAPPSPEIGVHEPMDRLSIANKAEPIDAYTQISSFSNSAVLCLFVCSRTGSGYNYPAIRRLIELATGRSLSVEEMMRIGERNMALLRIYSGMVGYKRVDDRLPSRFYTPLPHGGSAGKPLDEQEFRQEVSTYYELAGWDDAGPTDERLRRLGMDDLVGRLVR